MTSDRSHVYVVTQFLRRHVWVPRQVGAQRQHLLVLDPIEKNVALLNEFKPDVICSGTYLTLLFGYLHRTGAPCHLPQAVTYGSEGVPPAVRRLIMDEFHVPVLSTYQATEALKLGFECDQHRGYHLNLDLYPLRLVDPEGRPVPVGETGEVVLSNLVNRATVLLNYRLNDLATLLPDPCPCGRTLPLLSFLQGRGRDFLRFDSGQVLHPATTDGFFAADPGIWQYQVVQQSGSRLALALLTAPSLDREQTRRRLVADFQAACGEGVEIEVSFVEAIPCTPGGKIRPVVALPEEAPG
jgi:phenylacetate-CoA ligase